MMVEPISIVKHGDRADHPLLLVAESLLFNRALPSRRFGGRPESHATSIEPPLLITSIPPHATY
ncbi:hypothetical protein [Thiomonas sp.]